MPIAAMGLKYREKDTSNRRTQSVHSTHPQYGCMEFSPVSNVAW